MVKYLSNINLQQHELQNAVIHVSATAPSNPKEGQVYFNNEVVGKHYLAIYQNGAWFKYYVASEIDALLNKKQDTLVLHNSLEFDGAGNLKVNGVWVAAEQMALTNKTFDANADGNILSNVEVDDFAADEVVLAEGEAQADAQLMSKEAIMAEITSADTRVDDATIEKVGTGAESYIRLKDGGITVAKLNDALITKLDSEEKSAVTLPSLAKVEALINEATPDATTETRGLVKLATQEEIAAGTDATKATTPKAVHDYIAAELTSAIRYRGQWDTTDATDYSGLNSFRPMKQGDMFLVAGSGCTIDGVEYRASDHIVFNKAVSASTAITTDAIDKIDNTEAADIVRLEATQTLTNKTIDATANTIANLNMLNLANANAAFADSENTDELKAAAKVPSLAKVETMIATAAPGVDDVTVELFDNTAVGGTDHDIRVKDNGLTASKVANGSIQLGATEEKAAAKLASKAYVDEAIVAERSATATLTNHTLDADNNTLANVELDNFKEGVVVTEISKETASDTKVATEKAITDYIQEVALVTIDETNPALTPVNGVWTWTLSGTGNAVCVTLFDATTNEVLVADVVDNGTNLVISGYSDTTIAADTLHVRILK